MRRRNFLKRIGSIGAVGSLGGSGIVGTAFATPSLERGFNPQRKHEAAQYLHDAFSRIEELEVPADELEHGHDRVSNLEDLVLSLSANERDMLIEYISENATVTLETDEEFTTEENVKDAPRESSTTNFPSRASYTGSLSANITLPLCQYVYGTRICYRKDFHSFDYEQTLEWYYNNQTVSNASQTSSGNGSYYLIVGWTWKGNDSSSLSYHPDNYYVESHTMGRFERNAFVDYLTAQNDYGELNLVGHSWGGGRTEDKNVIN